MIGRPPRRRLRTADRSLAYPLAAHTRSPCSCEIAWNTLLSRLRLPRKVGLSWAVRATGRVVLFARKCPDLCDMRRSGPSDLWLRCVGGTHAERQRLIQRCTAFVLLLTSCPEGPRASCHARRCGSRSPQLTSGRWRRCVLPSCRRLPGRRSCPGGSPPWTA